jgi:hypothetical protein
LPRAAVVALDEPVRRTARLRLTPLDARGDALSGGRGRGPARAEERVHAGARGRNAVCATSSTRGSTRPIWSGKSRRCSRPAGRRSSSTS